MKRVSAWTRAAEIVARAKEEWGRTERFDEIAMRLVRRNTHNRRIEALAGLEDSPHPDKVREVTGDTPSSFYSLSPGRCSECGEVPEELVRFSYPEGTDGEYPTDLCLKCLLKAVMLLDT